MTGDLFLTRLFGKLTQIQFTPQNSNKKHFRTFQLETKTKTNVLGNSSEISVPWSQKFCFRVGREASANS